MTGWVSIAPEKNRFRDGRAYRPSDGAPSARPCHKDLDALPPGQVDADFAQSRLPLAAHDERRALNYRALRLTSSSSVEETEGTWAPSEAREIAMRVWLKIASAARA